MTPVARRTAQQQLIELTEAAAHGEDVISTQSDGSAFRLVLLPTGTPTCGSAAGQIAIRADGDDPPPEFEAYYA